MGSRANWNRLPRFRDPCLPTLEAATTWATGFHPRLDMSLELYSFIELCKTLCHNKVPL